MLTLAPTIQRGTFNVEPPPPTLPHNNFGLGNLWAGPRLFDLHLRKSGFDYSPFSDHTPNFIVLLFIIVSLRTIYRATTLSVPTLENS